MIDKQISRRGFIKASAAAAGASMMLSGAAPNYAAPQANKAKAINIKPSKKALVFIMLDGGNDSYNMLVPTSSKHYKEYQSSRSNLSLGKQQLLSLDGYQDSQGRTFGVHGSMRDVQQLFKQKKLAFVANTGPMIEPVTKDQFYSGEAKLPLGLLSHSDQFKHWQTARPELRINRGWFGYFADALQPNRAVDQIPMNISLSGSNIMQNGILSSHYSITQDGNVGLIVNKDKTPLNNVLLDSFEKSLNFNYRSDPLKQSYLSITREAQAQHEKFSRATDKIPVPTSFSDTALSQQLRKVVQSIKAADSLGQQQQTYFLRYIGWDHHDELLNNHARMLSILSKALGEFQLALDKLDLADKVITFTGSDFGRTLTSNGNGTDHGWGGNTLVMGEPVNGGQVFGDYPSLALGKDNPLDVGDGVLIPTTPIDALYEQLALWFGTKQSSIKALFPNLSNFEQLSKNSQLQGLIRS